MARAETIAAFRRGAKRRARRDPTPDLLAAVADASLDPSLWGAAMALASQRLGGAVLRIGMVDENFAADIDAYSEHFSNAPTRNPAYLTPQGNPALSFVAASPALSVATREAFISDGEMLRNEFYNECMRPYGFWHNVVVNVLRDERRLAPMGVNRTRAQGPFTTDELRWLRNLAPHLHRAMRVHARFKDLSGRATALATLGDASPVGAIMTNASGAAAHLNAAARDLLDQADGLLLRDGILRTSRNGETARLAALILDAAGGPRASSLIRPSGTMTVSRPSGRRPLPLVVAPTRGAGVGRAYAVTISFADPEHTPEPDATLIQRLYGLSRREAEVAALLAKGLSPGQAAETLTLTMNTVRTHIKHMFDKLGVERLDALTRVLLTGPAALRRR